MALTADELADDPHPALARARRAARVAWAPALGRWLVLTREPALRVMRDDATFTVADPRFSTQRVVGPSMLSLDGAEHARHRAPFAAAFRRRAVLDGLGPFVEREVARRLDALSARGGGELRRDLAGPVAVATMARVLGLDAAGADPSTVLGWYRAIVAEVDALTTGRSPSATGAAAVAELGAAVDRVLDAGPGSLLAAAAAAGLAREEVVSNAAVLLFGGVDTTEGAIATAALRLLERPALAARARSHPAVLDRVLEESLRHEPAAAMVDRYATRDVDLAGASIRRGDLVTASITAANRDPAAFAAPDRFDPGRPDLARHVAFAHGPHVCLGMHLARLEIRVTLRGLVDRGIRLDPAAPRREPRGLVFRKPATVSVVLRAPAP